MPIYYGTQKVKPNGIKEAYFGGQLVYKNSTGAVSFATDDWEIVAAEAERISNYYESNGTIPSDTPYSVYNPNGIDTDNIRTVSLSTNETIQIFIADFCHDQLQAPLSGGGTKAGITFGMLNCLATKGELNPTATNGGGWNNCQFRQNINTYINQLPQGLRDILKTVVKSTSAGLNSSTITTTNDKLFLPSVVEVYGVLKRIHNGSEDYAFPGEGTEYKYFKNAPAIVSTSSVTWPQYNDTGTSIANGQGYVNIKGETTDTTPNNAYINYYGVKLLGSNSASTDYFTRSPNVGSTTGFCYIAGTSGTIYSRGANNSAGISYMGCI